MKGWYVIWNEDTEDFSTKREALKRAKEFYKKACCLLDGEDANSPKEAKKQLSIFDF